MVEENEGFSRVGGFVFFSFFSVSEEGVKFVRGRTKISSQVQELVVSIVCTVCIWFPWLHLFL